MIQLDENAQVLVQKFPQMVIPTELGLKLAFILNPSVMLGTPVGDLMEVQRALQAAIPVESQEQSTS